MIDLKKGKFIVFEGIDGCGKTTQINKLYEKIHNNKDNLYVFTREHTKNIIGSFIDDVLNGKTDVDKKTLALLYAADRFDHVLNPNYGILKYINEGNNVICDRYYLSSYAYQMVDNNLEWIKKINRLATKNLKPDLTIVFDVPVSVVMERLNGRSGKNTIFEKESFLSKVSENYKFLIEKLRSEGENISVLDGTMDPDDLSLIVLDLVNSCVF